MSGSTGRPGDRVVRRRFNARREIELPEDTGLRQVSRHTELHAKRFVIAVAAIIGIGTLLLALPYSTRHEQGTPLVDALFTSASAVSVTGLVTVDTATHWNFLGQFVIVLLMQVGGISFTVGAGIALRLLFAGWPAQHPQRDDAVFWRVDPSGSRSGGADPACHPVHVDC